MTIDRTYRIIHSIKMTIDIMYHIIRSIIWSVDTMYCIKRSIKITVDRTYIYISDAQSSSVSLLLLVRMSDNESVECVQRGRTVPPRAQSHGRVRIHRRRRRRTGGGPGGPLRRPLGRRRRRDERRRLPPDGGHHLADPAALFPDVVVAPDDREGFRFVDVHVP